MPRLRDFTPQMVASVPHDGVIELIDLFKPAKRYARELDATGRVNGLKIRLRRRGFNGKSTLEMLQRLVQSDCLPSKRLHICFSSCGTSG